MFDEIESLLETNIAGIDMLETLSKYKLIIWGTGSAGIELKHYLNATGINILCFCDNDQKKHGKTIDNKEIISPEQLSKNISKKLFVCIASDWSREIALQLKNIGIRNYFDLTNYFQPSYNRIMNMQEIFNPDRIRNNIEKIKTVYSLFNDDEKKTFVSILLYRLTLDPSRLILAEHDQYMHPAIKFNKGNIIIDGGAHHGQTSLLFGKKLKGHCKIYAFEPDSVNFDRLICLTKFGKNNYIKPVMAGFWETNMFGLLNTDLESRSTSKSYFVDNNNNNGAKINLLSIDSFCESHQIVPSHIKMDIEGSEMKALQGAKNIIKQHKPSLIISLYHKAEDLWEIPFFLTSVGCKYKYYIGQYSSKVTDTVLYCTT